MLDWIDETYLMKDNHKFSNSIIEFTWLERRLDGTSPGAQPSIVGAFWGMYLRV